MWVAPEEGITIQVSNCADTEVRRRVGTSRTRQVQVRGARGLVGCAGFWNRDTSRGWAIGTPRWGEENDASSSCSSLGLTQFKHDLVLNIMMEIRVWFRNWVLGNPEVPWRITRDILGERCAVFPCICSSFIYLSFICFDLKQRIHLQIFLGSSICHLCV